MLRARNIRQIRLRRWRLVPLGVVALLATGYLAVTTLSASAATQLLSQGKPATASSTENAGTPAAGAVDGDAGTRWSSAFADPQWLQVDLGSSATISQVVLQWETAYASAFQIQVSADAAAWTTVYSTTTGTGGTQTLNVSGAGRYVRLYGTARGTPYGYSLWEFQVYGETGTGTCGTTNAALNRAATASSTENAGTPAAGAVDGNAGTRWSSAFSDPQWLQVDLGASAQVCQVVLQWETAYATAFQIQLSANGSTWTNAYSTTTGTGGTQTITVTGSARYVRMNGTARATPYGYSLWELEVHVIGSVPTTGPPTTSPPAGCPWVGSTAPVATRVSQLLSRMTTDQKISILHGNGASSPYIGNLTGIPSLCIPNMGLQDGPGGVGDGMGGVTQMPSAVTSAATFDPALEQEYGAAIGAEFAGKGANVALGPTLNIVRDPRWGRAFETFSEDPYLTSQMTVADVRGIQSQGVMAQAKHAAVYNQETNRNGPADNAIVDDRTLQEIYLPGFQAAVTQGATASIMCGYATVNGTYDCDHPYLLNTALYQQAGFGGFVTSDWGAAHSTVPAANNGMTMEMPGGYFYADFLRQAVANGQVSAAQLDLMVTRVLTPMFAFGLFDKAPTGSPSANVSTAAHADVARRGAEEGTVLLKNTGILPLSTATTHSIAVLGVDGGAGVQSVGGGSATATSSGTVWPLTGIQNRVAGTSTTVTYNDGTNLTNAVNLARGSDVAIVFASNNYGNEGSDQTTIDLPGSQNQLISQVAAANPRTIVVLHTNSATTMPWLDQVAGVFEGFYAGQQVGTATAALLFGDANPSGKLPVSFPKSLADVPAHTAAQWPGANNQVQYSEALKVGYRWYDSQNIAPLFPFGYGLSYTSFGFSNLQVGALNNGKATVTATVSNTGSRAGTEVVQLYVGAPAAAGEPPRSLKGFQRVTLNAGQSTTVTFTVTAKDLAYWNTSSNAWTTASGTYQISVGNSSRSLPLTGNLAVTAATVPSNLLPNPYGMSSPVGRPVSWAFGAAGATYTATGLPAGLSISAAGVISGTATSAGTSTVTVTASTGASATFVWTTTP
ncbi:glycoside hydrolase family 3 C-terminal domain-containing protein [Dactylosporangium sp. CA-092794]|uniref:glycoside hydrolase family 3 C-terminal domain-containing protein n=1 Tax=Dactylosporangium sp. CA-092794 TaxID=3239929 RepID=UPI003D8A5A38